jgi:phosphate transport system substrate-binding protein
MHKTQSNPATAKEILKFFTWAYSDEGAKLAGTLDYVPMPAAVVKQVQASWSAQLKDSSGKPIWP